MTGVDDLTPRELLDRTTVSPDRSKDLLRFEVEDQDKERAPAIGRGVSQQYVRYRREVDTDAIRSARRRIEARIERLGPPTDANRAQRTMLSNTRQRLTLLETLQLGNATYVQQNSQAVKVQPTLVRDAIIAVLLGLALGVGAALLVDAFDSQGAERERGRGHPRRPVHRLSAAAAEAPSTPGRHCGCSSARTLPKPRHIANSP